MQTPVDNLAPAARQIVNLDPSAYTQLVVHGDGDQEAKRLLEQLNVSDIFSPGTSRPEADAKAVLAGLWLWHDWLERSHALSQSLSSPTGSFWHAIMHRREGDFSNSKYWYARALNHPVMASLAGGAATVVNRAPADKGLLRIVANGWNPNALVDLAEEVSNNSADARRPIAIELQQMEWRTLWEYCAREA
jgi:hypothetical protein